jgi:ankyrin repeat protein
VLLLSCGGDINTSDGFSKTEKTLIQRALKEEDHRIFEFLFRMGATVDESTLQSFFYNKRLRILAFNNDVNSILQLPLQHMSLNDHCERLTGLGVAIQRGNIATIEILHKAGATHVGRHISKLSDLETAKYLDAIGLLSNILCSSGQDILTAAIDANDNQLVQYILPSCANQITTHLTGDHAGNERPRQKRTMYGGGTPLEAAIDGGKMQVLEALLSHGAQITDDDLERAVVIAANKDNDSFLRRILTLRSPLTLNAPQTIHRALMRQKPALIKLLLDAGIDPRGTTADKDSTSVLEAAVSTNDDGLFQTILTSVEWPKEILDRCFTASIWHRKSGRARYFRDIGADLNQGIKQGDDIWYPVQIAVHMGDISLTKSLLDYGCDPNKAERFSGTRTPLQAASADGNIEMLNLLLEAGADPSGQPICDGTTALQFAVKRGNLRIIQRLLNAGSDVNSAPDPYSGATALQFAAVQGFIGIARRLLAEGADVNAGRAPKEGRTCLEGATEHGRLDMLHFLLEHGALIEGQGRRQYIRAVKLAEWNAHSTIATYLRAHGQWTDLDSQQAALETREVDWEMEPDYENDLAWDYGVSWDSMRRILHRPFFQTRTYPSRGV